MRLLDLCCGAGGAAVGYHRAGFDEVVGVDIVKQPRYPFCFVEMDALAAMDILLAGGFIQCQHGHRFYLRDFDAIHASPPCQGYSRLRHLPWLKGRTWPLLIEPTRKCLIASRLPSTIENVMDAPLVGPWLCGRMFGLPLYRHRRFESNWRWFPPYHLKHGVVIGHGRMVNDRRKGTLNAGSSKGAWGHQSVITVAGGQCSKPDAMAAMGIDWMTKAELTQAIPPVMTEYIGKALLQVLGVRA